MGLTAAVAAFAATQSFPAAAFDHAKLILLDCLGVALAATTRPIGRIAMAYASEPGGKAEAKPDVPTGEKCPNCGHDLVTRHGRFGDYVSCSNYPACRFKPPKPVTLTGVKRASGGLTRASRVSRSTPPVRWPCS